MGTGLRRYAALVAVGALCALIAGAGLVGAHNRPAAGHVKFAHKSDSAKKVNGFTRLPFRKVAPSASDDDQNVARAAANPIQLYSRGPFRIYAKCFTDTSAPGNPLVSGGIYIRSTVGGAVFESADSGGTSNGFFGPGTQETDRELLSAASAAGVGNPGTLNITDGDSQAFWAAARKTYVSGNLFLGTKVGNPTVGNGVFGAPGHRCIFGGVVWSK